MADDLEALRLELGVDRMHLVGPSFGPRTAVRYASRYSAHVASVLVEDMDLSSRLALSPTQRASLTAPALASGGEQDLFATLASADELVPELARLRVPVTFVRADPRQGGAMWPAGFAAIARARPDAR